MPINYGKFCCKLKKILDNERPDLALVHGDTNTTLFGSVVTSEWKIPVAHIEAGLRCYDSELPEEINRIATDHLAKFLFVPSEEERLNLLEEGLTKGVYVVGNTIVDAIHQNLALAKSKEYAVPLRYFFLTLHRRGNVDDAIQFKEILTSLLRVYDEFKVPFVFPVHPRTADKIRKFHFDHIIDNNAFLCMQPLGYLECLYYQSKALLVVTDSGGIQEESCVLKVPCITLRNSTERPATIKIGSNKLVESNRLKDLVIIVKEALIKPRNWNNPFGDGKTAERIVRILENKK